MITGLHSPALEAHGIIYGPLPRGDFHRVAPAQKYENIWQMNHE